MKNLAAIVTVFFPFSHADVILSRWNKAFEGDKDWGWIPDNRSRIISISVEQFPQNQHDGKNDITKKFCEENEVTLYDTVEEALTLGGKTLAVDGVLLIGEHGDYPSNFLGQKLYPRKELFDRIVAVFKKDGRTVPIFCDKHLSWNPDWAQEMVRCAETMGFPLFAGSTTPYCGLQPAVALTEHDTVEEALGVYYGGEEVYGYHSIELLQSILQNRLGGESGIKSVVGYRGRDVERGLGRTGLILLEAALSTSKDLKGSPGMPWQTGDEKDFSLVCFQHYDGFTSRHLMLDGYVCDWTIAVKVNESPNIMAGRARMGGPDSYYGHFATMNNLLESMFVNRATPIPIGRALMTTRMIAIAVEALHKPGIRIKADIRA